MNRYSQISPSQFNPLSMEEIFMVPLAKQAKHDQAQNALDELGLFDINSLDKDRELADNYINDYTSKLDQEIESIASSGINNKSIGKIKALARERDEWTKRGQGRNIKANYDAYAANQAELKSQYDKGKISAEKYQLGLQQALNSYEGVANGGSYNPFTAVADTDYVAEALELAQAVPVQEREAFLVKNGYQLTPDGSMYIHGETGQEFTQPQAIANMVIEGLGNNSNIMSDLKQRQSLGLFGERSVKDVMLDLANTMETNLRIDNNSINTKITGNKGYNAKGNGNGNGSNIVYNARTNAPEVKVFSDGTLDKLSKVGTVTSIANENSTNPLTNSIFEDKESRLSDATRSMMASEKKLRDINNINLLPEERNKLDNLANKMYKNSLFRDRLGLKNADLTDQETLKKVTNYIKNFQNIEFTQNVINANSSPGQLNSLPNTESSLMNQSNEYIKTEIDAGGIQVYDQETGEKLDESDISNFDDIKFTGYYSPDNLITHLKEANDATMTSPGEIIAYKEGKKVGQYYVSRPTSDMDTPEFQAAKLIKNIKVGMVENLGLENTIELPREIQQSKAYKNINYMYDPDTSLYTISMDVILPDGSIQTMSPQTKDGEVQTMSSSQLQSTIYKMYGITRNQD